MDESIEAPDGRLTLHPNILKKVQRSALKSLAEEIPAGFYLCGGTAVALHLGHRRSDDFDWFTAEPFPEPLGLASSLGGGRLTWETREVAPGTLHGTYGGVLTSFLEFRYPELAPRTPWPGGPCELASLEDLAAMKLAALAQRGARKDFVDIYALCRDFEPLPELVECYRRKFSIADPGHLLFALAYFDDADKDPMPRMLWRATWPEIKKTIRAWVRAF